MTTEPNSTVLNSSLNKRARAAAPPVVATVPTKSATVVKLLLRTRGATSLELVAATGWQPHSVRAFLSGLRKKGQMLAREARKTGEFAYRLEVGNAEPVMTISPSIDAAVS